MYASDDLFKLPRVHSSILCADQHKRKSDSTVHKEQDIIRLYMYRVLYMLVFVLSCPLLRLPPDSAEAITKST